MNKHVEDLVITNVAFNETPSTDYYTFIDFQINDVSYYLSVANGYMGWRADGVTHRSNKICPVCKEDSRGTFECEVFRGERLEQIYLQLLSDPSIRLKALLKGLISN